MSKLLATLAQMVQSKLVNRKPVRCGVCGHYICYLGGLPVVLNDRQQMIEFAHPGCCATDGRAAPKCAA